jgi:hypothetical protein
MRWYEPGRGETGWVGCEGVWRRGEEMRWYESGRGEGV